MNEQDGQDHVGRGAVLDTNTVLDMLLFDDPAARPLRAALEARRLQWLGCDRMLDELRGVLLRPRMGRWAPAAAARAVLDFAGAHMRLHPLPSCAGAPVCRDPADQVFIDLAWSCGAKWLLTRDKALLRLAHKAGARGLWVGTPSGWSALEAPTGEASASAAPADFGA